MLPSIDGIDICRKLRSQENQVSIIMLTAKSEEIDRVIGLETGADDYIVKPFSIREFKARVKTIMRRSSVDILDITTYKKVRCGNLEIDVDRRIVEIKNERIELTPKEFELLLLLACNPGKSFTRQNLLNSVWGYDFRGFQHTVNSHINRLRAKIEEDMSKPQYILTSWGYGYRFNDQL
jgi:DNA-binding response OmpR family regulator